MSKVHLIDTVDEMKKLNARRRLKGAVMAAIASPKWSLDPTDPDHFSDYGDDDITSAGDKLSLLLMFSIIWIHIMDNSILQHLNCRASLFEMKVPG